MPAQNFESPAQAADAIRRFYYQNEATMDEHVKAKLAPWVGTGSSPVDLMVNAAEVALAEPTLIPADVKPIFAGAAMFADNNGFHGMNKDSRGAKIAALLDGQTVTEPPTPKEDFKKKEVTADPGPVAATEGEPAPAPRTRSSTKST